MPISTSSRLIVASSFAESSIFARSVAPGCETQQLLEFWICSEVIGQVKIVMEPRTDKVVNECFVKISATTHRYPTVC